MARTISSQRTVADGRLNIIPVADIVIRYPFLENVDWFILSNAIYVMMNIALRLITVTWSQVIQLLLPV